LKLLEEGVAVMAHGFRFKTARDLFTTCPAIARDMRTPPTDQNPVEFCRDLLAGRVPEEAITFCAYLLPERAGVWWAHECLSHLTDILDVNDQQLLVLVHDWVGEPDRHRTAIDAATATPPTTPVGWIVLAAARRDNSAAMTTGQAINAGILAGLARVALADRFSVLSAFVEMGIQMAEIEALRQSADA
jgi:hypothetical protein